ncbi:MAG: hypothetical protein NTV80_04960 [Verrucomicrobia bacterium]|nr:hypothetical protein [Verrucomicrobiota bacterium]
MKVKSIISESRFFETEGFVGKGSGRYYTLTKSMSQDRAVIIEADLHRKFGEFRLGFRAGVRFHSVEEEFYKLANGEYGIKEDSNSFTLWSYMTNIPSRSTGPDQWTFQDKESDLKIVIEEIDGFFFNIALPWLNHLIEPEKAIEWMVANQFLHRADRWDESIACYFLAKHYFLPVPAEALTGIFECAHLGEIGSSVCMRLIERELQ